MFRSWIWFLLLLVVFELVADILAKQFAIGGSFILAGASITCFVIANTAWLMSLRAGAELSKGIVILAVLTSIGAVLIGAVIYHEELGTFGLLGLLLGILAIALLSVGEKASL
jgi:multidrug transporter EmrE-like cation transporter